MDKQVFVQFFELIKNALTMFMPESFLALPEVNFLINLFMFGIALYFTYFFIIKIWLFFGKIINNLFRGNKL